MLLRWASTLRRPLDLDQPAGAGALIETGRRKLGLAAIDELVSRGLLVQSHYRIYQPPALVRDHVLAQARSDRAAWRRLQTRIARVYAESGDAVESAYHLAEAHGETMGEPIS